MTYVCHYDFLDYLTCELMHVEDLVYAQFILRR